jgi:ubiquinone/menaquinone biosynthesis C-methylase UbiE
MKTPEQMLQGYRYPLGVINEHLERYCFAGKFIVDKNVLDIACGCGYGTSFLARRGAKSVIGVDRSVEALECAKFYTESNLKFINGDAYKLEFENNTFDVIISFETIEHLDNPTKFVTELQRVLKKDGTLIISTPNKLVHSPNSLKPVNPHHVHEYFNEEFKSLLFSFFSDVQFFGQRAPNEQGKFEIVQVGEEVLPWYIELMPRDFYYETKQPSSELSSYFVAVCKESKTPLTEQELHDLDVKLQLMHYKELTIRNGSSSIINEQIKNMSQDNPGTASPSSEVVVLRNRLAAAEHELNTIKSSVIYTTFKNMANRLDGTSPPGSVRRKFVMALREFLLKKGKK